MATRLTGVAVAVALGLAGAGCSRNAALPSDVNPPDIARARPVKGEGPCPLLEVGEVDLALNVSISDGSTPETRPALAGMRMCGADDANHRSVASWGLLDKDAVERFEAHRRWNKPYLSSRRVAGRPATWDAKLRTLIVLDGARAFAVQLTVESPPTGKGGGDRQAYAEGAAKRLAERALPRLPK